MATNSKHDQFSDVLFKEIEGTAKKIRIHKTIYKGREMLSIQCFYIDRDTGEWAPSRAVVIDYEQIDDIISGLEKMKIWCEEHPQLGAH